MRLPDTTRPVPDLTRWNRAGLSRFRYVDGAAAEWLEYLRICHLLLYARDDAFAAGVSEDPADWVAAFRTGKLPDGTPIAGAAAALAAAWDRTRFDATVPPEASYGEILRAQYDHIGLDQTRHLARAVVRALHILTETLDAYANECFIDTATQPEHLRMLLETIGFRPRPAASARVPVALMLTAAAGERTFEAGLGFEFNPNDGGPLVTFESLAPLKAHPGLNAMRPVGWDRADDLVATTARDFVLASPNVLNNPLGGSYGLLGHDGAYEPVRIEALDKAARRLTVTRFAPEAQASYRAAGFRLAPTVSLRLRPRGAGWVHFEAPPQAHVGQSLDADIAETGFRARAYRDVGTGVAAGDYVVVDRVRLDPFYRAAEIRGADLRLSPAPSGRVEALYPVKTPFTKGKDTDASGNLVLIAGPKVRAEELGPIGEVAELEAGRCYAEGGVPQGLAVGEPAVFVLADGGVRVGSVGGIRTEENGFSFVPSAGITATTVAELHGGFTAMSALAYEPRSSAPLLEADGRLYLPAGEGRALLATGRALLIVPDPAAGGTVLATEIVAVEAVGDELALSLAAGADSFAGLVRGRCLVHGNVAEFGHGKAAPRKVLGSGDNALPAQAFTMADGPLATRPNPAFPGGVQPDIEIEVAGRRWRQVADLAGEDTTLAYAVSLDDQGRHVVAFGQRLPTGADNVVLARSRIGAGARGNLLPAGAVTALKPAHPAVTALMQPLGAQSGADVQDAAALRAEGGSHFALADRALAVEDFAALAQTHADVWHAHAALERVTGPFVNTSIALTVVPAGGGPVESIREELAAYLAARAAPGVALDLRPFQPAPFGGRAVLSLRPGYARSQSIIDEIAAMLMQRFGLEARALGRTLYVTELVGAIESHEAVQNMVFTLTHLWDTTNPPRVVASAAGTIQAVVPRATQSVHLPAGDAIRLTFAAGG